jgi:RHS repeat-associated protein
MKKDSFYDISIRTTALLMCAWLVFACTNKQDDVDITRLVSETREINQVADSIYYQGLVNEIHYNIQNRNNQHSGKYSIVIPAQASFSAEFLPGISDSIVLKDVKLMVPGNGIHEPVTFSITGLLYEDLPPLPGEICNVTGSYYKGYRFLPHGMIFDSPAAIAIAYDSLLIPEGYTAEDIYTWYFDESDNNWIALERDSIDYDLGRVVSHTDHFTDMINGIIRIPESPETDGFVPTTITDLKAADPAEGIALIAPPSANSDGDARLSYPIKLPEGRAGMQPELKLNYSSDGGSSWTGYGWDLNVSGISVDDSWGVPRYLPGQESETYLFSGSQLTPVAHRGDYIDRTSEKRFYSRIESSFSRIIRHGDNPANYWWEVTTKEGERSFYGGLPGSGIINDAVSMDADGNIGYWALTETRDLHNNFVNYKYDKPEECGEQVYIREICYSGHNTEEGPYKVIFVRNDEGNTFTRKDGRIDARLGFIKRETELLRRIDISLNEEPIRSYAFQFMEGEFCKTLLKSISECDGSGNEFYRHSFDYYDDIKANGQTKPYKDEVTWNNLPDDHLKDPFFNPVNTLFDRVSLLGGSGSWGWSAGSYGGFGFNDGSMCSKSWTLGGSFTYQSSESEGYLALVDLNGDGMPDKVFKTGDYIWFRPNQLSLPDQPKPVFGDPIKVSGISSFSASKTKGYSWGLEANIGSIGFIGRDQSSSTTNTHIYFDDFNADGLIDIASGGEKDDLLKVYFNHLNNNGVPVFSDSSILTPNPLYANNYIDLSILPDPDAEQARNDTLFPLHDAVRMWQAPYDGTININAPVNLVEDTSAIARADKYKDGVRVAIQINGSEMWNARIDSGDFSVHDPGIGLITVNTGDRIYFRVQSVFNGSYDKVFWDPEILYDKINGSDTLAKLIDANGINIGRYKASEDFVLCGQQSAGLPYDGQIRIKSTFSKPVTSDTLELNIVYTDSLKADTIYHSVYNSKTAFIDPIDTAYDVITDGSVRFTITSSTNVDWSKISFDPYIEYTSISNQNIPVTDTEGNPTIYFNTVPEFALMYNLPVRQELPVIADTAIMILSGLDSAEIDDLPHQMKITPDLTFNYPVSGNTIILSVKKRNEILGKKKYYYSGGVEFSSDDSLIVDIQLNDTIYFEYFFPDFRAAGSLDSAKIVLGHDTLKVTVFSPVDPEDEIFGHLYRGWGQFDYNGNFERADLAIDESSLNLDNLQAVDLKNAKDLSALEDVQNPLDNVFNVMIANEEKGSYTGTDQQVFILPEYVSGSRLGEKNIIVEPVVVLPSGLNVWSKVAENSSVSWTESLIVVSPSQSTADNNLTRDLMDMNGDRYPDLVSASKINYTGVNGVLTDFTVNHSMGNHHSTASADGWTFGGGSSIIAKSDNTGGSNTSKNVKSKSGSNSKTNKNASSAESTATASIGINVGFSDNTDEVDGSWLDINGDGLPDKVYSGGRVRLNLGYKFAPEENWDFDEISAGESHDFGGGGGFQTANGSWMGGLSFSRTDNNLNSTFLDINSDGLPDMIKGSKVCFNTGSSFEDPVEWPGLEMVEAGHSFGSSLNTAFTFGFGFLIPPIKIVFNPSGSVSTGVSYLKTHLADIDGDGMPDFLTSDTEDELNVKLSTIFRTNILKKIERPLGSDITLDYLLTPCTYKHPGGKLALGSVEVFDGVSNDGADTILTTIEYEDGFYDRRERQFYGFSSVKTCFRNTLNEKDIYRTIERKYSNTDYYTKGMILAETLIDSEGRYQSGIQNAYSLWDIHTHSLLPDIDTLRDRAPAFAALEETRTFYYGGASEPKLTTRVTYDYDTVGNISTYTDYSSGNQTDMYTVTIRYHSNPALYLYSTPSLQEVTSVEGLIRKNETLIDEFGDITEITKFINSSETAKLNMEYDEYGNLLKVTRPSNYKGERMWYEYEYDPVVHSYVTRITDAYGYASSSLYDYKWGVPVEATDMNNQKMEYSFDDFGRMKTITGPFELESGKPYTISYEYFPGAEVPYAHTMHYDSVYDSDIEIYSFCDGLGRPVQVKKTALLFEDENAEDKPGYIVTGKVIYDAFGRATETYHPVFENYGSPSTYNSTADNVQPVSSEYDVQDRILKLILSDGSTTSHKYDIGYYNGEAVYTDSLTDALGNCTVTYTKANGKKAAVVRRSGSGDIVTGFRYNAARDVVSITDPLGNISTVEYDMLGRRLAFNHPDAGLTEFVYDAAGNIIKKITSNLRKQIPDGGAINYKYDRERLTEVVYPRNIQNRVNYTYGEPGASFNRAGRLVLLQDASGGQEFFYGRLGEVTKTIRTVQLGESDMRTWIWSAAYDTWNRVRTMDYPDGEKISYSYNRAGNLQKIEGKKLGQSYEYISRIGYNKYENQVFIMYGNGSVTKYDFEPRLQRLVQIDLLSDNNLLMNSKYAYDPAGNILSITNNSEPPGNIGGKTSHIYSYDELYRLTNATGTYNGKVKEGNYSLAVQYDVMGKILRKTQSHLINNEEQVATTYDLAYKYESPKPNTLTELGERRFTYDANGNQTGWQDTVSNDYRQLAWDEENRLTLISDNGYLNKYVYDATGERVIKSHGGMQGVYINGAPAGIVNHSENDYTVYVSPYFVFTNNRFTKHLYNGSVRVCSKIGNGQFANQYRPGVFEITAGRVNYINRQQQLQADKEEFEKQSGIAPGPPTMKGIYADPLFSGTAYPDAGSPDLTAPPGWPQKPIFAPAGGPPGAPIQWGDGITNDNAEAGVGFLGTGNFEEDLRYFYHNDHLGSAIYITNATGEIAQYIAYMPFGETFVEQHSDWDSPFKFNAREIDNETGLYYYGSRYYDPKVSFWLGIDLLKENYFDISPYAFCRNNPLKNWEEKAGSTTTEAEQAEKYITDKNISGIQQDEQYGYIRPFLGSLGNSGNKMGTDISGGSEPEGYQDFALKINFIKLQKGWKQKGNNWGKNYELKGLDISLGLKESFSLEGYKKYKEEKEKAKDSKKIRAGRMFSSETFKKELATKANEMNEKSEGRLKKEAFKKELETKVKEREARLKTARKQQSSK